MLGNLHLVIILISYCRKYKDKRVNPVIMNSFSNQRLKAWIIVALNHYIIHFEVNDKLVRIE